MVKLTTMDLQEMLKLTSPFSIGVDDFFRRIDDVQRNNSQSYPPYNITKIDDEHFVIEIACAGFGKDHIDITVQENELKVVGDKENPNPEELEMVMQFTLVLQEMVKKNLFLQMM